MVDLVTISRQGMQPDHEEYRYPHAGTPNAASDLQIVEFVPKQYDEVTKPELATCGRKNMMPNRWGCFDNNRTMLANHYTSDSGVEHRCTNCFLGSSILSALGGCLMVKGKG